MNGLLTIDFSDGEKPSITAKENVKNRDRVAKYWMLGPERTAGSNNQYWSQMSLVWGIPTADARRQLCANCEYFNNTPEALDMMEAVPEDRFDRDGGGRGYCEKFEFICHNLRACQAWEGKESENGED